MPTANAATTPMPTPAFPPAVRPLSESGWEGWEEAVLVVVVGDDGATVESETGVVDVLVLSRSLIKNLGE